jgi:hypothetical protein
MSAATMPVQRWWKRLVLTLLAVTLGGGLAFLAIRPINGVWVGQLEAELNRDLPDGSTKAEAQAWFTSRGFFTSGTALRPNSGGPLVPNGIMSIVPNETLFEYAEIRITVTFDTQGRVCKRDIYRWVRCL